MRRYNGVTDFRKVLQQVTPSPGGGRGEAEEGFVIRFRSGLRAKVKLAEYVRLHRILTGVSSLAIWEYLSEGKPLDELLERVPDEFYQWVQATAADLLAQYSAIEQRAKESFAATGQARSLSRAAP